MLCAGKGKRVAEHINYSQKCMFPVYGKPLLAHIFEHFESVRLNRVYFVIGYKGNEIKNYFDWKGKGTEIRFIEDNGFEVDSTSRSLLLTKPFIQEDFLYSQGEIFYEQHLIKKLYNFRMKGFSGVIAISKDVEIANTHPRVMISN
ncbi:MAG: NTP transferase domain-containing protein, partial [Candidatus Melainabacteria bacterium]|nr:NTP transferase domain-containing protein [Candidatus Melainabacteria bacterium]